MWVDDNSENELNHMKEHGKKLYYKMVSWLLSPTTTTTTTTTTTSTTTTSIYLYIYIEIELSRL